MGIDIGSILDAITNSGVSDVLSKAAGSAQDQKNKEDALMIAMGGLGLNRDKFATVAPGDRMRDTLKAALAQGVSNAGPTKVNWGGPGSGLRGEVPTFSGGAHDALAGLKGNKTLEDMLSLVQNDELAGEQRGGASGGNLDAKTPDFLNNVGKSSLADKLLGGSALGTSLLSALAKGAGQGGGAGGNLTDLFKSIFGKGSGNVPGQTFPDGIPFSNWQDDPNASLYGSDYGHSPDPTPNVDTSMDFSKDPNLGGGFDWEQWMNNNMYGPEPSATWGG